MKRPEICLLILVILTTGVLAACAQGGSTPPNLNCSRGGEVCITTHIVDTFRMGDPVTLSITVTSSKDIPDLNVSITKPAEVIMDGPQTWENYLTASSNEPLFAYWDCTIKAGQTLAFNRVLHFPFHEGFFQIFAEAVASRRIIDAVDSFDVQITNNGGYIIKAGTPYQPYTPNVTAAVYGPGTPVPTYVPSATYPWTKTPIPSLAATSAPLPYPVSTPISTPSSYP